MINTHYMYRPPLLDADRFAAFATDVAAILRHAPEFVAVRWEDGTGAPEVSADRIALNGDRSRGEDHEALVIEQTYTRRPPSRARDGVHFDFCKTHGKPYDIVVVAVMYAFIYRFPECRFTSDSTVEELRPGFELFVRACRPSAVLSDLLQRPLADRDLA